MKRYTDKDLRAITGALDGAYLMSTEANLARDLLAARRALRRLHSVLVSNGARQCAPEYLEIIKRALPPRGARGSKGNRGKA